MLLSHECPPEAGPPLAERSKKIISESLKKVKGALTKTIFYGILIYPTRIGMVKEIPMLEKETQYWIFMSGSSEAAVLYDRHPKEGGKSVLWLRTNFANAMPAEGLNLGMLFQDLGQTPMIPPNFSFTGTVAEAREVLRREKAVATCGSLLRITVLEADVSESEAVEYLREVEKLIRREDVLERINELSFIPLLLQALQIDHGDEGVVRLRNHLVSAHTSRVTKLFFSK